VHTVPPQVAAEIAAQPQTPAAGGGDADVTIEFLDYNCPYCKKTALQKLLRADQAGANTL
jgi:protein-disulfide isomerase